MARFSEIRLKIKSETTSFIFCAITATLIGASTPSSAQTFLEQLFGNDNSHFGTEHEMITNVFSCYRAKILKDAATIRSLSGKKQYMTELLERLNLPKMLYTITAANGEQSAVDNSRQTVQRITSELWTRVVVDGEDFYERIWIEKNTMTQPSDDAEHFMNYLLNTVMDCSFTYFEARKK